jgi:hypothetical protein
MNLDFYGYITLLTPVILLQFSIDYLSDSQLTHSETEYGIYQLFHHIVGAMTGIGTIILPFVTNNLNVVSINIIIFFIVQIGFLKNKDYCWLTRFTNTIIDPQRSNRKWVGGDFLSLLKKYTRGDDWAYSDIYKADNKMIVVIFNLIYLFMLVKINVTGKVR